MPHPIVHLGISIGVGYIITGGARRGKEDWRLIGLCTFLQGLMDLDHLFSSEVFYFQNLLVAFNIPIMFFIVTSIPPPSPRMAFVRRMGLIWAALGLGHLAADMWTGGTYHFLYPFSSASFSIPSSAGAPLVGVLTLNTNEMVLAVWGIAIVLARLFYTNVGKEESLHMEIMREGYISRSEETDGLDVFALPLEPLLFPSTTGN